jgi:group I intron endonuclease
VIVSTMSGVYAATHIDSGRMYVGKSVRVERRWWEHLNSAETGAEGKFHRALKKYGADAFRFEMLEHVADETEMLAAERYWIEWYDTVATGFNLTPGGDFDGSMLSPESREKIAAKLRGRKRPADVVARVASANRGRVQSPEERAMRSARQIGRKQGPRGPLSDEHKAKLRAAFAGRVFSAEHKAKLSAAAKKWRAK